MIIPVVLQTNWEDLVKQVKLADTFASLIQIDFADGILTKAKTFFDVSKIKELNTRANLELHLMVDDPFIFLNTKLNRVSKICLQVEAKTNIETAIIAAKELGYKIGISINPDTSLAMLEPYVNKADYIQFLAVQPGKQGQQLIPDVLEKIKQFRDAHPTVRIQVDGGIKKENVHLLVSAGANDFVVGSAILNSPDPRQSFVEFSQMTVQKPVSTIRSRKINKIAFLGGAAWKDEEQPYKDAYEVAKILAQEGYEIVNGGGPGVMRASTQGAHAAGARALAITYHPNKPKRHYEGVDQENEFDEEIITLDYFDRTKIMLQTTQLHVVFKGSLGTLSEFGMSWISSWIHEPDNKPIILYGGFWKEFLENIEKHLLVADAEKRIVKVCTTPQEVLDYVISLE